MVRRIFKSCQASSQQLSLELPLLNEINIALPPMRVLTKNKTIKRMVVDLNQPPNSKTKQKKSADENDQVAEEARHLKNLIDFMSQMYRDKDWAE